MANIFERSAFGDGVDVDQGGNVVGNVSTLFGTRTTGGVKGLVKTEGAQNEATVDFDAPGPIYDLKIIREGAIVTDVQAYDIVGTIATVTVGDQDVSDAQDDDKSTWVVIDEDGEFNVTGPTGGKVVVKYRYLAT